MASLSLQHIDKIYDNNVQAVYDFNMEINDGEFIVLVGPSGCGKSTTLRMVAGLEDISNGKLFICLSFLPETERAKGYKKTGADEMPAPASPKNGYSKARLSRYRTTSDAGVLYEISLCPELYTLRL